MTEFDILYKQLSNHKAVISYLSPAMWRTITEGGGAACKVAESLIRKILELEAKQS